MLIVGMFLKVKQDSKPQEHSKVEKSPCLFLSVSLFGHCVLSTHPQFQSYLSANANQQTGLQRVQYTLGRKHFMVCAFLDTHT